MEIFQLLFGESEIIVFLMIVVFRVKKLLDLCAKSLTEIKCGRYTFELLSIKLLVSHERFHILLSLRKGSTSSTRTVVYSLSFAI